MNEVLIGLVIFWVFLNGGCLFLQEENFKLQFMSVLGRKKSNNKPNEQP